MGEVESVRQQLADAPGSYQFGYSTITIRLEVTDRDLLIVSTCLDELTSHIVSVYCKKSTFWDSVVRYHEFGIGV